MAVLVAARKSKGNVTSKDGPFWRLHARQGNTKLRAGNVYPPVNMGRKAELWVSGG